MISWPVPSSLSRNCPASGPGSFWEDRGDRRHCGVDIYALAGADVVSVEDGIVVETGLFTEPSGVPYWNTTHYALVEISDGLLLRYAELDDIIVSVGDAVSSGQKIGHIGTVLNTEAIGPDAPDYIRCLKSCGNTSMLHFELLRVPIPITKDYRGGNWFGRTMPQGLMDPSDLLGTASELEK